MTEKIKYKTQENAKLTMKGPNVYRTASCEIAGRRITFYKQTSLGEKLIDWFNIHPPNKAW